MANFIPGITACIVLLIFLAFISTGQRIHETNPNADISLFTNTTEIVFTNLSAKLAENEAKQLNATNMTPLTARIIKIAYRLADAGGYTTIQIANMGVEYGFDNPNFQAKEASDVLMLLIYLEIAIVVFIPACAIIYGIYLLAEWIWRKLVGDSIGTT